MKSRVTTYLLIAVVAGVWGVVAWKLFFARPDPLPTVATKPPERKTSAPEADLPSLDYEDPFLKNVGEMATVSTAPSVDPPLAPTKPAGPSKPRVQPRVQYAGTIEKGGRVSHLFEHAGLLHKLTKGDEIGGYTISEIFRDSVLLSKDGEEFTIYVQR